MSRIFTIEPYVGAHPLTFSMHPEAVSGILGLPRRTHETSDRKRAEDRDEVNISYSSDDGAAVEFIFMPSSVVMYHGMDIFRMNDPIAHLRRYDNRPMERVGFIFFPMLGIAFADYHEGGNEDWFIRVFKRGLYDSILGRARPYGLPSKA
jgi:hypothetical protein